MMTRAGSISGWVGAAMLMASAVAAHAQTLPADLLKVHKVQARGQSYWVQIEERFTDPEVQLPDGQLVRAWRLDLAVAVSRAGRAFVGRDAERAEAQAVAAGFCRAKGLALGPAGDVSAEFSPTHLRDLADWTFTGLCHEPRVAEVRK